MKTALSSRKKFGFLDGSIGRPEEGSPDLDDWWKIQALMISWIRMTIDHVLRSNISHWDVAKDLWEHLKKRFSVTNGFCIQQLKAELASGKQRGLTIESYYGKLNRIWDSMTNHRPLCVCKCGKCECNLTTLQELDREEDKVHNFLSGIDEPFNTVRSTLVSRVPIQPLEVVYNVVRQEEDLRNNVKKEDNPAEITAYAVQQQGRVSTSIRVDDAIPVCTHCHRSGHSSDRCFLSLATLSGGVIAQGAARYKEGVVVVMLVFCRVDEERANYIITNKDRNGVSGLDDKQWERLMKLFNASGNGAASSSHEKVLGTYSAPSWVLDTGASHHLTGNYDILPNVQSMEHVLSDLISLGQLMDENRCIVQMADQFLVVQDRASRMLIGAGKRDCGTFRFCRTELEAFVTDKDVNAYELWHNRMGHPSPKVVGSLPNISVSIVSELSNKLINRTPSSVLNGVTPYEKLHGAPPTYDHLKVFGSLCYAQNQTHRGDKFAPRNRKCVFVGYPYGKNAWRLYDLYKQEFFVSRDEVFSETEFPYATHVLATNIDEEDVELWATSLLGPIVEEPTRLVGPLSNSNPVDDVSSPVPILSPSDQSMSPSTPTSSSSATPTSSSPSSGPSFRLNLRHHLRSSLLRPLLRLLPMMTKFSSPSLC
ncbi:PREDICTED: uncharacterized protein LOC104733465 [Camelina sativa]|uniref:Uncharacterized protein LOC104733465 n=1 Tax=Camelina sativa TaxID=90675 RepID=A0ABM0V611_CAMSA|nr:PREDICTED: uncharacterized protein LOC104733465 [Camelina sativa]